MTIRRQLANVIAATMSSLTLWIIWMVHDVAWNLPR